MPFDALEIKPIDEAALPPDFVSKLRIALYISRINDLADSIPSQGRHWMSMARTLEKDLKSMVSGLRQNPAQWNPTVEFVYLGVLLNIYSICLRCAAARSLDETDHVVIQSSAAQSACRLIELFASSPLPLDGTTPCPQRYCAKYYFQFHGITLLMLSKISALNQISLQQLGEVDEATRVGHGSLMSCSSSRGDEAYRAAAVVEILSKKGVVRSVRSDSPVHSRLGASLWLELLAAAHRWRRQNSNDGPRPKVHSARTAGENHTNGGENNTAFPSALGRVADAWGVTGSLPLESGVDATALMDLPGIVSTPLLSIEDWFNYLDVAQADLGVDYHSGWWGGVGTLGI